MLTINPTNEADIPNKETEAQKVKIAFFLSVPNKKILRETEIVQ